MTLKLISYIVTITVAIAATFLGEEEKAMIVILFGIYTRMMIREEK